MFCSTTAAFIIVVLLCCLCHHLLPHCHAASVRYTPQPTLPEQPTAELSSHSNGACRYGHEALQWVFAEPQLRCVGAGCDAPDAAECTAQLSVWCERLEAGSAEWGNCTPSATHRWHLDDAYNVLCDGDVDNKCGHDAEACIFEYGLKHHHHYYGSSSFGIGNGFTAGSAAAATNASTVGTLLIICVVAVAVAFLVFAIRHLLSDATAGTQTPSAVVVPYGGAAVLQQQQRGRSAALRHLSAVATPATLPPVAHFVGGTHVD
jgi:succinate dehydrogenase/fumarate reductase cytochrome b subunit